MEWLLSSIVKLLLLILCWRLTPLTRVSSELAVWFLSTLRLCVSQRVHFREILDWDSWCTALPRISMFFRHRWISKLIHTWLRICCIPLRFNLVVEEFLSNALLNLFLPLFKQSLSLVHASHQTLLRESAVWTHYDLVSRSLFLIVSLFFSLRLQLLVLSTELQVLWTAHSILLELLLF